MKFFSYICNRVALDTGMCAALPAPTDSETIVPETPPTDEIAELFRRFKKQSHTLRALSDPSSQDPLKRLQESSLHMDFYYLQQVNTTYRIGTNSYPKYYLTWEWANKKLYFRSKMTSSQYQKFAIKESDLRDYKML